MKNVNIGIANLIISNKLKESYFNDSLIVESKKVAFDFFEVVKKSPVLQLEFKVYNNIESKHIENELLAKEYIDNHIKLFEVYTVEEIEAERAKLNAFLQEDITELHGTFSLDKIDLYNAVDTLITESLKVSDKVDVDEIHEAFTLVFNHIKSPKAALLENVDVEPINEDVLEIAVGKFNEKYSSLDESDKELLKRLIKSSDDEKFTLLETMKTETRIKLNRVTIEGAKEGVEKAIKKVNEMVNKEDIDDDIISLHGLTKELL